MLRGVALISYAIKRQLAAAFGLQNILSSPSIALIHTNTNSMRLTFDHGLVTPEILH